MAEQNFDCAREVQSYFPYSPTEDTVRWHGLFNNGKLIGLFKDLNAVVTDLELDVSMVSTITIPIKSPASWDRYEYITNANRMMDNSSSTQNNLVEPGWLEVFAMYTMLNPNLLVENANFRNAVVSKMDEFVKCAGGTIQSHIIQNICQPFLVKFMKVASAPEKNTYNLRPRKHINYAN